MLISVAGCSSNQQVLILHDELGVLGETKAPVWVEETLEIFAFMQAAEESKIRGGISVDMESVKQAAQNI